MRVTTNKLLNKIQDISDETGWNNVSDISETVEIVLNTPDTLFFSEIALFEVRLYPPSGNQIGKYQYYYNFLIIQYN